MASGKRHREKEMTAKGNRKDHITARIAAEDLAWLDFKLIPAIGRLRHKANRSTALTGLIRLGEVLDVEQNDELLSEVLCRRKNK